MNQVAKTASRPLQLPQVERIQGKLKPLRGQYPSSQEEANQTEQILPQLKQPADSQWTAQRVVSLLSHYYVAELHPAVHDAIARDWVRELSAYPEWALETACQWWVSKDNKYRHKKPMPGDISLKAHEISAPIRSAQHVLNNFKKYGTNPPHFIK